MEDSPPIPPLRESAHRLRAEARATNAEVRKDRVQLNAKEIENKASEIALAKDRLARDAEALASIAADMGREPITADEGARIASAVARSATVKAETKLYAVEVVGKILGFMQSARKAEDTGDLGEVETLLGKADLHPGSSKETPAQGT